ncbi:MAG: MASE3 domain-containing protein, partial [Pseudohongiella sp.]
MLKPVEYKKASQSSRMVLLVLCVVLLVPGFLPLPGFGSLGDYLPLHTLLETIAIVVAAMVFTVGWHTHQGQADFRTVFVSCLFLGVAVLDFSHVLSYQGMPDFVTPSGPDKTIDFWLAARSFAAVALIAAALLPTSRAPTEFRLSLLAAVGLALIALHTLFLFFPQWVPDNFNEDTGLTAFKVGFEYVLVLLYGTAAFLLWRRSVDSQRVDTLYLAVAASIMALSELLFTYYMTLFDVYNVSGHLYKVLAYIYLYRALVVSGIVTPYQSLARVNSRLRGTLDSIPDLVFEIGSDGTIYDFHSGAAETELLAPPSVFVGRRMQEFIPEHAYFVCQQACADIDERGRTSGRSYWLDREDGLHWYEIAGASIKSDASQYLLLVRDVTEQRKMDAELRIASAAFLSQEGIMVTDATLSIQRVNSAFERSTGYSQEEVKGKTPHFLQSGRHDREFYRTMWHDIETTGSWHGEIWNRRRNGEVYPQSVTIT